jgi:hypothetical protein
MYASRLSSSEITTQHETNVAAMETLKTKVSPLKTAATNLAQTAREMKEYATQLERDGKRQITSPNGERVAAKDLIKNLKVAKDAIKGLESKVGSLDREVNFFSNHQIGLLQGNVRAVPPGDKVNWCTGEIKKIQQRASRLAQSERSSVANSVRTIENSANTLGRPAVTTDLPSLLSSLA